MLEFSLSEFSDTSSAEAVPINRLSDKGFQGAISEVGKVDSGHCSGLWVQIQIKRISWGPKTWALHQSATKNKMIVESSSAKKPKFSRALDGRY